MKYDLIILGQVTAFRLLYYPALGDCLYFMVFACSKTQERVQQILLTLGWVTNNIGSVQISRGVIQCSLNMPTEIVWLWFVPMGQECMTIIDKLLRKVCHSIHTLNTFYSREIQKTKFLGGVRARIFQPIDPLRSVVKPRQPLGVRCALSHSWTPYNPAKHEDNTGYHSREPWFN